MAEIVLSELSKVFPDGTEAVSNCSLEVPDGALVVLVGPSGCGKTTLLRMIAGLDQPTNGTIRIGSQVINDTPAKARDIAMVFQNYALYPHMSVYENMAFALKRRRVPRAAIRERIATTAVMLGLSEHLRKKPAELSGGQRQRVAMGRAIVRQPQAFLMDEPLSNLDAKLRTAMRTEIRRIQRALGVTTIFVTHDQTEAMTMGDFVVVMRDGAIQQVATPDELFDRPANVFVADFVGSPPMNLLRARVRQEGNTLLVSSKEIAFAADNSLLAANPSLPDYVNSEVVVGIRPEDIAIGGSLNGAVAVQATVELEETIGRESLLYLRVDADPRRAQAAELSEAPVTLDEDASNERARMVARIEAAAIHAKPGDVLEVGLCTSAVRFFDPQSGLAL
jgi:multiple sugar transport system ATP-binding protein